MGRNKDQNQRRFLILLITCSIAGVVLGGTASWAEGNQCLLAENPTNQCLTRNPLTKTIEGMATGLVAGLGAAVGASWQRKPW